MPMTACNAVRITQQQSRDYMTKLDIAYEETKVFINENPSLKENAIQAFNLMEQEIEDGSSEDNEYELFVTGLEDLLIKEEV